MDINGSKIIDSYSYCHDKDKIEFYNREKLSQEELEKSFSFMLKLNDYRCTLYDAERLNVALLSPGECAFHYKNDVGFIFEVNSDRDIIDVYYCGKTEEEAFLNAIIFSESRQNYYFELKNREKLFIDFKTRFSNLEYSQCFYYAELSLKNLYTYFDGNIPFEVIKYYESYLNDVEKLDNKKWKYSKENNCFEIKKNKKRMMRK